MVAYISLVNAESWEARSRFLRPLDVGNFGTEKVLASTHKVCDHDGILSPDGRWFA